MSMKESCGFTDIEASEDVDSFVSRNLQPAVQDSARPLVKHLDGERLALDELKGMLSWPSSLDAATNYV